MLPRLVANDFVQQLYRKKWLLRGIGEGNLAQQIDPFLQDYDCTIGYRCNKPYIELKIACHDEKIFLALLTKIEMMIAAYLVKK